MQVIYPQPYRDWKPSPLAGLGGAAKTLADAIIMSRERQAVNQDFDLLSQALGRAHQLGQPQTGYGEESGDPFTIPAQAEDPEAVFQELIPKMKTPKGKAAAVKLMMEMAPREIYTAEGQPTGRKVPGTAKILAKPESSTTVYDPKSGRMIQVPGRFAQVKEDEPTPIYDAQGNLVGTSSKRPFQLRQAGKEWKPDLFEGPNGERRWIAPGESVPENYNLAGKNAKDDPTGYTREGKSWMKLVGLDPSKKEAWDIFNNYRSKTKDKDLGRWALQTATSSVSKTYDYTDEPDPKKRAEMIMGAAQELMRNREKLAGGKGSALQDQYKAAKARVEAMPPGPVKQAQLQALEKRKAQYGL